MSDIRTKLLLGTTLASVAMIFVMAAGVDAFDTKTSTASQAAVLNGHVTVMAIHPDGSATYAQGDNNIVTATLANAIQVLMSDAATDKFNCIDIGTGAGGGNALTQARGSGVGPVCDATATAGGSPGIATVSSEFTIVDDDVTPTGTGTAIISEAVLQNGNSDVLSSVGLSTDVGVISGSVVTIDFTLTLT